MVILGAGGQIVVVSLRGNKIATERNVANGLMQETFEAVHAAATENWINIFDRQKDVPYHPIKNTGQLPPTYPSGAWVISHPSNEGSEILSINGVDYTRSFRVQNVCRDGSGAIVGVTNSNGTGVTCTPPSNRHDPSTQKISVAVSWPGAAALSASDYVTRWPNRAGVESTWTTQEDGANLRDINSGSFDTRTNIDYTTTPGSITITP